GSCGHWRWAFICTAVSTALSFFVVYYILWRLHRSGRGHDLAFVFGGFSLWPADYDCHLSIAFFGSLWGGCWGVGSLWCSFGWHAVCGRNYFGFDADSNAGSFASGCSIGQLDHANDRTLPSTL